MPDGPARLPRDPVLAGEGTRRHRPSFSITSAGRGSGVVAKPVVVPAGTGTWSFMRIMSRQVSTCCQALEIAVPLRPVSRPEVGRSSRVRPPFRRAAAVLAPMPRTPGMLSDASPASAR